jgi:uncharacterized protein with von Willebrand factor type A (vWA) domain
MTYQIEKFLGEAEEKKDQMALEDADKDKLNGLLEEGKKLKADENADKEAMEKVMKEIEELMNAMYEKYGGAWNSDAKTENP